MLGVASAPTPFGEMTIVCSDAGVLATFLPDEDPERGIERVAERRGERAVRSDRALAPLRRELAAYFSGKLRSFTTPVDLSGFEGFTYRVYEAAIGVPYGELRTYGDVAAEAGSPRGWRAAGHALRVSPIELWIPCHRIVPAGPGFGRYGGHPERRELLLRLEGAI